MTDEPLPPPEPGEVLFRRLGEPLLGEWLDLDSHAQRAWAGLEAEVADGVPGWVEVARDA